MPVIPSKAKAPQEPAWRKAVIEVYMVNTLVDPRTIYYCYVEAEVYGLFGVHKTLPQETDRKDHYVVTHVSTKRRLASVWWEDDAKQIAEILSLYTEDFKSSDQAALKERVPKYVQAWLLKCDKEHRYVELEIPEE